MFNIKNGIKEHNPLLAGEMSGHIFFNDKWYGFDDGIYSGARIIELILKNKKSISSLNKELPELFSTHELNIEVSDESKFEIVNYKYTFLNKFIVFKESIGDILPDDTTDLILKFGKQNLV